MAISALTMTTTIEEVNDGEETARTTMAISAVAPMTKGTWTERRNVKKQKVVADEAAVAKNHQNLRNEGVLAVAAAAAEGGAAAAAAAEAGEGKRNRQHTSVDMSLAREAKRW